MVFVLIMVFAMFVGRKLGWIASRAYLYGAPPGPLGLFLLLWGMTVAAAISFGIHVAEPGGFNRWLFGYLLGGYVAVPNFGLYIESTVPDAELGRHVLIKIVPLIVYVLTSIALAMNFFPPELLLWPVCIAALFAPLAYLGASRSNRLWRTAAAALVILLLADSIVSLLDLALIGDALPGGAPTLARSHLTQLQQFAEYGVGTVSLILGWFSGRHHRIFVTQHSNASSDVSELFANPRAPSA